MSYLPISALHFEVLFLIVLNFAWLAPTFLQLKMAIDASHLRRKAEEANTFFLQETNISFEEIFVEEDIANGSDTSGDYDADMEDNATSGEPFESQEDFTSITHPSFPLNSV
ncbi:hypothetical protein BD410DRAFT_807062 [Rickenella mellea]|uniref:Uncharacterized protein n=1 Tax=Rickenella mellea TaxID=50990 RepID=A0A4Y7PRI4_9AGAM|nr:hypothetical protein BD410DRAFT_807062 [Rickenella mellea]